MSGAARGLAFTEVQEGGGEGAVEVKEGREEGREERREEVQERSKTPELASRLVSRFRDIVPLFAEQRLLGKCEGLKG